MIGENLGSDKHCTISKAQIVFVFLVDRFAKFIGN